MPFESGSQRRFMYSQHPELAKEFEKATPKGADLPEHVKKLAEGGTTAGNPADIDSGVQDASVSDFLAPFMLGPAAMEEGAELPAALKGLGEVGEVTIGRAAPKMEEAAEAAAPKVEPFIKGIQKSPNGNEVKIWGVRGDPSEIAKLGYGSDPASVPENILRDKGILPAAVDASAQTAPNGYDEGGLVDKVKTDKTEAQKADDVDPVVPVAPLTSTDTPKGYNKGGYPHVTFLENESPAKAAKDVHLKAAKGGAIPKKDMSHEDKTKAIYKAMGIKKYADGGDVTSDVDTSQLPGATPNPSDPDFWDQIKAALAQVGSSTQNALGMSAPNAPAVSPQATNPNLTAAIQAGLTGGASAAVAPLNPTATPTEAAIPSPDTMNTLGMGRLPSGAPTPPPADPTAGLSAPSPAPSSALVPPTTHIAPATSTTAAGMPNIGNIFNQDTSGLTKGYNPEDRQALVSKLQSQQHGLGSIIAEAVAGLGDAISAKGLKSQNALGDIFSMQTQQRQEALANFDKARQDRVQKLALQTQMGNNALNQAAAADAYGVDEHLNSLVGAPKGTMKKDLPTYFSMMSAQIAAKEKDEDLYMKSHAQASTDVDNAVKNSSVLGIKPSPAQLQASGQKLADNYYNKAKGNVLVKPSDGGQAVWLPAQNIGKAKQMDPNLQVMP